MCNFHISHQDFFKAQPTLNLYMVGLQISCVWIYDEWPQLQFPLLQKARSLAKNQQENHANLVGKSIFTHEAGALSKPGLLKEHLCVQTPIPSPCLLFSMPIWHNAKSLCVFSCPGRLDMMSDPWWASEPGQPFFCTSLGKVSILPSLHPPEPTPGDFTVSQQLLRLACGQVMCQIHLSHLQAEDSPMNNSERNNHLHGPFSQPQVLSLTSSCWT